MIPLFWEMTLCSVIGLQVNLEEGDLQLHCCENLSLSSSISSKTTYIYQELSFYRQDIIKTVAWNVKCSLVEISRRFRGTWSLHNQSRASTPPPSCSIKDLSPAPTMVTESSAALLPDSTVSHYKDRIVQKTEIQYYYVSQQQIQYYYVSQQQIQYYYV